jgi:hypothetical protein
MAGIARGIALTKHQWEFAESENPWAPAAVIADINERTGGDFPAVRRG